ncbi:MAG: hypothetical protein K2L41_07135 [Muribaculaceae bacterium]|nr:hypothetical protein [Muribaculaceae bacterium]
MMHVSGHKTQKTFMDYVKLPSEEIADEMKLADELDAQVWLSPGVRWRSHQDSSQIAAMSKKENDMW